MNLHDYVSNLLNDTESQEMNDVKIEHELASGQTIKVVHGDLTQELVDVITNAANVNLAHGGGVAGTIVRKGGRTIQHESNEWVFKYGLVTAGNVAITSGGTLPCKSVIHAVDPIWHGGTQNECELLQSAIWNSLMKAHDECFTSLAMPAISSGIFGFPKKECARILIDTTFYFCNKHPKSPLREIHFTNFDELTVNTFYIEFKKRFVSTDA